MEDSNSRVVRIALYRAVVATGGAPAVSALARETGLAAPAVVAALRTLADDHVVVLEGEGPAVRFAAPFAAGETRFPVICDGRRYFAPCAWDAFGIPAALRGDADIDARCAQTGVPLPCGVRGGRAYGDGLVHLLVPAARFWDDIVFT